MVQTPKDVTDAELAVLHTLWELGASTTRQLADVLYPQGTASQSATVLKLLERLEAKECVKRRRKRGANVFEAVVQRNELIERRLQSVAESLCEGSRTSLLMYLVNPEKLTREERDTLRQLVDDLGKKSRSKTKKKS
jgi:predicted transcriptional regulator